MIEKEEVVLLIDTQAKECLLKFSNIMIIKKEEFITPNDLIETQLRENELILFETSRKQLLEEGYRTLENFQEALKERWWVVIGPSGTPLQSIMPLSLSQKLGRLQFTELKSLSSDSLNLWYFTYLYYGIPGPLNLLSYPAYLIPRSMLSLFNSSMNLMRPLKKDD